MANRSYRKIFTSTEGHRYDGVLVAEFIEETNVKMETIWRCDHAHEDWREAEKCAQAELMSRGAKGK